MLNWHSKHGANLSKSTLFQITLIDVLRDGEKVSHTRVPIESKFVFNIWLQIMCGRKDQYSIWVFLKGNTCAY